MAVDPTYAGAHPKTWETIGRLVGYWARYEAKIYNVLAARIHTKYQWDVTPSARVLVFGLRYGDMAEAFVRICKERPEPEAATKCLEEIISEAAKVKRIRDIAAHRDFTLEGTLKDPIFVFELWNRKSKSLPKTARYSRSELETVAAYARVLSRRADLQLRALLWGREVKAPEAEQQAWLEKPSLPKPPNEDIARTREGWTPPDYA